MELRRCGDKIDEIGSPHRVRSPRVVHGLPWATVGRNRGNRRVSVPRRMSAGGPRRGGWAGLAVRRSRCGRRWAGGVAGSNPNARSDRVLRRRGVGRRRRRSVDHGRDIGPRRFGRHRRRGVEPERDIGPQVATTWGWPQQASRCRTRTRHRPASFWPHGVGCQMLGGGRRWLAPGIAVSNPDATSAPLVRGVGETPACQAV